MNEKENRFSGIYEKTGSSKVTDKDLELVKKADEKMKKHLDAEAE